MAGGYGVWLFALNAFLSDISPPDSLAFRYGMLNLASSLGRAIGPPLGAQLLERGGFVCVFTTSLVGTMLGGLALVVRVASFQWTPQRTQVSKTTPANSSL